MRRNTLNNYHFENNINRNSKNINLKHKNYYYYYDYYFYDNNYCYDCYYYYFYYYLVTFRVEQLLDGQVLFSHVERVLQVV